MISFDMISAANIFSCRFKWKITKKLNSFSFCEDVNAKSHDTFHLEQSLLKWCGCEKVKG